MLSYTAGAFMYNGTRWTPTAGGGGGDLLACASASLCVATDGGAGDISTWNATSWHRETGLDPNAGDSAVSCTPGGNSCMVIDANGDELVDTAGKWAGPHSALPAMDVTPDGLACVNATSCYAITTANNTSLTLYHWDGASWSARSGSIPGTTASTLACATNFCITENNMIVTTWNGHAWSSPVDLGGPQGASSDDGIDDIACPSATACVGVVLGHGRGVRYLAR